MTQAPTPMAGPSWGHLLADAVLSLRLLGRRSALALSGIVIGTMAIVALMNLGRSAATESLRTYKSLGTDILVASLTKEAKDNKPFPARLDRSAMLAQVPELGQLAAVTQYSSQAMFAGVSANAAVVGSTPDLAPLLALHLSQGRLLTEQDQAETYVVLGARVAKELSARGTAPQPGDRVRLGQYLYQVVGILAPAHAVSLIPIVADESVFLPIAAMARLQPLPEINYLVARSRAGAHPQQVSEHWQNAIQTWLGGRQAQIQIPQQLLEGLQRQSHTFSYLLAGLGGISLLVGGVGVMNVMLMSVNQRRSEIGIRLALGASPGDILRLFLLEAACLSVAGAVLGLMLGLLVVAIFARLAGWELALQAESLVLGAGSSLLVGLGFGLYPALSAARLQPVEALRHA